VILACSSCDSRYDVTGYEPGQQFRCRCGTITQLAAPSSQAGLLRCPHCGAGVGPQSASCIHCNHALLLKACPRCLTRVFHGHEHCPTCGTVLSRPAEASHAGDDAPPGDPCPRCESPLAPRLVGDIVIDECAKCLGVFLDALAIERIIEDRRQARADALLGELPSSLAPMTAVPPGGKLYVKCPRCATIMNRKQFATGAGVIIDVCKKHGTFFDVGELPAIIKFVMHGGLEKAAHKDIERVREQARAELARARDAHVDAERHHGHGQNFSTGFTSGGALVDLLFSLWR
jgi:Zn-finger nucleic acid-binding protein